MKRLLNLCCVISFALAIGAQVPYVSQVWNPDLGNGMYKNPVINADYSDPDVIAVGNDYYLTASSFESMPGLPILHSTDLVNWEIVGHALREPYNVPGERLGHGNGVWAPCIRFHQGEFYIYWGDPDTGVFMVKTKDPKGEWEKPVCVIPGKGMIDTTPLWDDDGRCYLANGWANSRAGFASVLTVRELNAEGTKAIGDPVIVFDGNGTENRTCEGPKFYKREGWYWIMCPAGGVPTGFQLAMRSKNPYGPYEVKKVLEQGSTAVNGPHQGGWVHTAQGEDWFMHFQDKGAYGRVVHLQPVTWKDNWPVMGKVPTKGYCGQPVMTFRKPKTVKPSVNVNPQESDEFNTTILGRQWQWEGYYDQKFGMPTPWGYYRLYTHKLKASTPTMPKGKAGVPSLWDAPNLLLQKTPADCFTATAKLRFTSKAEQQYAGIVVMGLDYSALVVRRVGENFVLQRSTCIKADKGAAPTWEDIATLAPTAKDQIDYQPGIHLDIYLRMVINDGKADFFFSSDGRKFKKAGNTFAMKEGKWIGAKIGLLAEEPDMKGGRGWLDVDWFRITK